MNIIAQNNRLGTACLYLRICFCYSFFTLLELQSRVGDKPLKSSSSSSPKRDCSTESKSGDERRIPPGSRRKHAGDTERANERQCNALAHL